MIKQDISRFSIGNPRQERVDKEQGFTLIELSIVLVIIGLIVGGVLVGQDLIRAAELRATISQVYKYNAAVNTFNLKFGGLPGDLAFYNTATFGLYSTGEDGSQGKGDGNGMLEAAGGGELGTGENLLFWRHLSDANLVDGAFGANLTGVIPVATTPNLYFPFAKLGRGNYFIVGSDTGLNYFYLASISSVSVGGAYTFNASVPPVDAYNMDIKMDDGLPQSGTVQTHGTTASTIQFLTDATAWSSATTPKAGDCVTTGTSGSDPADTYNRKSSAGSNSPACQLRFRFN